MFSWERRRQRERWDRDSDRKNRREIGGERNEEEEQEEEEQEEEEKGEETERGEAGEEAEWRIRKWGGRRTGREEGWHHMYTFCLFIWCSGRS